MPYYPPQPDRKPDEPEKESSLLDRKWFRRGVLVLCVCLIAWGGIRLIGYGADWISSRRTARELKAAALETGLPPEPVTEPPVSPLPAPEKTSLSPVPETDAPTPAPSPATQKTAVSPELPPVAYPGGLKTVSAIRQLRQKSQYVIGWLTMDGLDEPVALKDNEFFLNHDAKGNRNYNGAIFMDEATDLMTRPYTIFLYGHNMKTGAMFGNLRKYEDAAYCQKHRVFRFDTLYEEGEYAAFAVAVIGLTPGTARYLNLEDLNSTDRNTRKNAVRRLETLSAHPVLVDVNEEDQILLLVTCTGDDDEREILAARRLRENEAANRITLK